MSSVEHSPLIPPRYSTWLWGTLDTAVSEGTLLQLPKLAEVWEVPQNHSPGWSMLFYSTIWVLNATEHHNRAQWLNGRSHQGIAWVKLSTVPCWPCNLPLTHLPHQLNCTMNSSPWGLHVCTWALGLVLFSCGCGERGQHFLTPLEQSHHHVDLFANKMWQKWHGSLPGRIIELPCSISHISCPALHLVEGYVAKD